ncbi:MAG: hypothetical protein Q9184_001541 [Pyrenodesmia sp. 2 TL-2023]
MRKDDYTSAAAGGLRLKGVSGSKIAKHKKKRPKHPETEQRSSSAKPDAEASESPGPIQTDEVQDKVLTKTSRMSEDGIDNHERSEERSEARGKTEAELRHEERRRKRAYIRIQLEERLKREGTKTHKERVEEFNHYLSNLSEHHDMPRIGPG